MTIRTILASLQDTASASVVLPVAAALARRHGAHLIGLHAMETLIVYPEIAMHLPGPAFGDFSASQKLEAADVEHVFRATVERDDFPSEWRLLRGEITSGRERLLESARSADLVVMAQPAPEGEQLGAWELRERVIRDSGRPVLQVPRGGWDRPIGQSALVGWSATREATRAAHDALGLLHAGAEVHILSVCEGSEEAPAHRASLATAGELARAYSRHGMRAETLTRTPRDMSVAEVLLQEAFACGADLIVTGALGHSSFYDFVIGAVTRDLMHRAEIPVLFSK